MMSAIVTLFMFSMRQTLLQGKILATALLLAGPCAVTGIVRYFQPDAHVWERYHGPMQFMLVGLVIPLVCMLYGTALIGSEVEGRTLVYLLTRRMRRATVLVVRFAGTASALTLLFELSGLAAYACAVGGLGADVRMLGSVGDLGPLVWHHAGDLLVYAYMIPIATTAYLAIFVLFGLISARPIALSIFYLVVIELIVGFIPVGIQTYTITHQLRAAMFHAVPDLIDLLELPGDLAKRLYPADSTGFVALAAVVVVSLGLACVLFTVRELVPAKVARE